MIYARFGDNESDVYVFEVHFDPEDLIECCTCQLMEDADHFVSFGASEMIGHLVKHQLAGHRVPDSAYELLQTKALEEIRYR